MSHLSFAAKAMLISVVFIIPMAIIGYFYTTSQLEQVQFSTKERAGIVALRHFVPVLSGVLSARNATRATLGGFEGQEAYQKARARTDAALKDFSSYLAETGDALTLKPEFDKLNAAWAATASAKNGVSSDGSTVFGPVSASVVNLLNLIGDNSNLVLDPDLDSFYLMDTLLLTLPQMAEDLGQLWGWGTFAIAQSGLPKAQEHRYAVSVAGVETGLRQSHAFLTRAFAANAGLKAQLDVAILEDAKTFVNLAKDPAALVAQKTLSAEQFYAKGEAALLRLTAFFDKGLPALDGLLQARIQAMEHRGRLIAACVLVILLIGGYLFYSFFLVTQGGLRLVSKHLEEMAEGDLSQTPQAPVGTDEPAQVLQSLITVHGVLSQFQAAQLDMAQQHAAGVLDHQMPEETLPGKYGDMARGINTLTQSHIRVTTRLVDLLDQYAKGDFSQQMEALPGQMQRITTVTNAARDTLVQADQAARYNAGIRAALDNVSSPVRIAAPDGTITYINHALRDTLRRTRDGFARQIPGFDPEKVLNGSIGMFYADPGPAIARLNNLTATTRSRLELGGRMYDLTTPPWWLTAANAWARWASGLTSPSSSAPNAKSTPWCKPQPRVTSASAWT